MQEIVLQCVTDLKDYLPVTCHNIPGDITLTVLSEPCFVLRQTNVFAFRDEWSCFTIGWILHTTDILSQDHANRPPSLIVHRCALNNKTTEILECPKIRASMNEQFHSPLRSWPYRCPKYRDLKISVSTCPLLLTQIVISLQQDLGACPRCHHNWTAGVLCIINLTRSLKMLSLFLGTAKSRYVWVGEILMNLMDVAPLCFQ